MNRFEALRGLCGSESRMRVFKALYQAPDKEYHLRGLAAAAGVDPGHLHKLLPNIIKAGLCEQIDQAPYPRYRARRDHAFFSPLRALFQEPAAQQGELGDVELKGAPILRSLLWTGRKRDHIPAKEAFQHYEKNWRFVRRCVDDKERRLIERLAKAYGAGLING